MQTTIIDYRLKQISRKISGTIE